MNANNTAIVNRADFDRAHTDNDELNDLELEAVVGGLARSIGELHPQRGSRRIA